MLTLAVLGAGVLVYGWAEINSRFEGHLWALPSHVFSAPPVVRPGSTVPRAALVRYLSRIGYGALDASSPRPGDYRDRGSTLEIYTRGFDVAGEELAPRFLRLRYSGSRLAAIEDQDGRSLERLVLEPELLATLHGAQQEERDVVRLGDLPRTLIHAVLAAEDARFYSHHGVDFRAVVRAAFTNLRSARIVQGGSTITQQTVKNLYLGQERTWWRKAREVVMAAILDWRYPKDRILEVYLNEVYMGQNGPVSVCGVRAGSRFYFGVDPWDLSLGEQATLAGLIRSPGLYNPFRDPERALERRDVVLEGMERRGFIDAESAARARDEKLGVSRSAADAPSRTPYVVDFVRSRLADVVSSEAMTEQGLRIYTTIDPILQDAAEQALRAGLERLDREAPTVRGQRAQRTLEGLIVALRPQTGEILAMVGGRDYGRSQFNRATQALRQPGSCFKPFVYLAGFEAAVRGRPGAVLPATLLEDEPIELQSGGAPWRPVNYDRQFRGPVSARTALEESLNVPTVQASRRIGIADVASVAEACGMNRGLKPLPALALGAQEVTPLGLATAYATIANSGRRTEPWIVSEVTDLQGATIQRRLPATHQAVSPQAAFLLNDVLQGVMVRGTAASAAALGFGGIAAGKTGTTDDTRDAWFVGYMPEMLALVWVGYDDNAKTGLTGSSGALPIWVDLTRRSGYDRASSSFREPVGIVRAVIDPESGGLAVEGCPSSRVELFPEGAEPRETCDLHRPGFWRRLRDRLRRR
jgi:penicillin-binding protein 1B